MPGPLSSRFPEEETEAGRLKGCVKGRHPGGVQAETTCRDPAPPSRPALCCRSRTCGLRHCSHPPPSAWVWPTEGRRREVRVFVPLAFFLPRPSTQDRGWVSRPSSCCSLQVVPPAPTAWARCTVPAASLSLLTPVAVPFVKIPSNYLLFLCHLILVGTLDETRLTQQSLYLIFIER